MQFENEFFSRTKHRVTLKFVQSGYLELKEPIYIFGQNKSQFLIWPLHHISNVLKFLNFWSFYLLIRGRFFVVSHRRHDSYQELFSEWKNIVPKLLNFQITKIHTIKQLHSARPRTLIAISRKSTLESISSYSFWDKCLKLVSYVLGTKKTFDRDDF